MNAPALAIDAEEMDFSWPASAFRLHVQRLQVPAGSSLAVIGESGAGKTTLLHLLSGVLALPAGRLSVAGQELDAGSALATHDGQRRRFRRRTLGLLFQDLDLLEHLDVAENILLPLDLGSPGPANEAPQARARRIAERLGILRHLRAHPGRLSEGERQRTALCRALIGEAAIVLLDEPTANLDPDHRHKVLDVTLEEVGSRGATLVVTTHDHSVLDRFDQVLDLGRAGKDAA